MLRNGHCSCNRGAGCSAERGCACDCLHCRALWPRIGILSFLQNRGAAACGCSKAELAAELGAELMLSALLPPCSFAAGRAMGRCAVTCARLSLALSSALHATNDAASFVNCLFELTLRFSFVACALSLCWSVKNTGSSGALPFTAAALLFWWLWLVA